MTKNKRNLLLSDALLVGAAPLAGYLLITAYYAGAESNLGLSLNLAEVDVSQSITIGFLLVIVIMVLYWLSEFLSRLVPKKNALLLRLRRDVQIGIFIGSCIVLTGLQVSSGITSVWDFVIATILIWIISSIPFLVRDIAVPYIKNRKEKTIEKRMRLDVGDDDIYSSTRKYYKSFFTSLNIIFLLIPILIIYTITYNIGKETTDTMKGREYIIIDTDPKQIVLINYGNRWITAKYDDSYINMPAYRKDYKIINKEDMGRDTFSVKYLDKLYVYN